MRRVLLALAATALLHAASPKTWELSSFQDFIPGRLLGVSLNQDGRITLAPKADTLFAPEDPAVWSVAVLPGGGFVAGTGHRGKLYRIDAAGKSELIFTSPEPEIFAVAVDNAGRIYAGTSPNGKVYRIEGGKASVFYSPGATYIWSIAVANDGTLFIGTGNGGRIHRVTPAGQGDVYYETGQSHVMSLAIDPQRRVLAGTEPNGIIYRIEAKDKAFVLHDAALPEIRALALGPDGLIYAAAMGGSVAKQLTPPIAAVGSIPTVTTSITVTADGSTPAPAVVSAASPLPETTGVEKSAIYRIRPDNSVETIWTSKSENIYDLVYSPGSLLFGTDTNGRIYRMTDAGNITLVAETLESEVLRLVAQGDSILAATSNQGKLLRLGATAGATGTYESAVHDTTSVARWGRLSWQAAACQNCVISLRTRSGNSARPDKTWSDWSEPLTDGRGSVISSPSARYIQWKAQLNGGGIDSVRLAYLPQNSAPVVKSISLSAQAGAVAANILSTRADAGSGTTTQPVTRAASEQIALSWEASDADGDKLIYALHFRGEQEQTWKLMKDQLADGAHIIDAQSLADGRYYFRVTASDSTANPPDQARSAELVSNPILIDRTPPAVTLSSRVLPGGAVEITADAVDAASPLKTAEYSINAGPWLPIQPQDGILDSMTERFVFTVAAAVGEERIVVVRASDSGNNAGLAKVVLR
jgi:hypothetical protein